MDSHQQLMKDYEAGQLKYVDLKDAVADALVEISQGFIAKKEELNSNKKDVKNQIKYSSSLIRKRAQQTLKEVKELAGLMNVKF
jgi:tryptophanyl-tRNA synthetase